MEQRNEKQAVVFECVEHQNNIDKGVFPGKNFHTFQNYKKHSWARVSCFSKVFLTCLFLHLLVFCSFVSDRNTANNVSDYKKRVELDIDINIALSNSTAYIFSFFYFWLDNIFLSFLHALLAVIFSLFCAFFPFSSSFTWQPDRR